jgi:hypothetical protein
MADDVKFVFIGTGVNLGAFASLATVHVRAHVRKLNKEKNRPGSPITPPAVVRFVHFDFVKDDDPGKILVYDHPFPAKGEKKQPIDWKPLEQRPIDFVEKSPKISIVDIYHAVRKAPRASVLDISLYSHGFVEGPVLANTDDHFENNPFDDPAHSPQRDPNDRDGRVRTDFSPGMGEDPRVEGKGKDALVQFHGGFAPGAVLRVYGCDVQDVVVVNGVRRLLRSIAFEVIRAAYVLKIRKKDALARQLLARQKPVVEIDMGHQFHVEAGLDDRHLSKFPEDQLLTLHYATDPEFFLGSTEKVITRPFSEVVKFAARQVGKIYVYHAAKALPGVTCFGALPGMSGEFEPKGLEDRRMHVPNKIYGEPLQFWKDFLEINHLEKGAIRQRHYGIFDAATVTKVENHLING